MHPRKACRCPMPRPASRCPCIAATQAQKHVTHNEALIAAPIPFAQLAVEAIRGGMAASPRARAGCRSTPWETQRRVCLGPGRTGMLAPGSTPAGASNPAGRGWRAAGKAASELPNPRLQPHVRALPGRSGRFASLAWTISKALGIAATPGFADQSPCHRRRGNVASAMPARGTSEDQQAAPRENRFASCFQFRLGGPAEMGLAADRRVLPSRLRCRRRPLRTTALRGGPRDGQVSFPATAASLAGGQRACFSAPRTWDVGVGWRRRRPDGPCTGPRLRTTLARAPRGCGGGGTPRVTPFRLALRAGHLRAGRDALAVGPRSWGRRARCRGVRGAGATIR